MAEATYEWVYWTYISRGLRVYYGGEVWQPPADTACGVKAEGLNYKQEEEKSN